MHGKSQNNNLLHYTFSENLNCSICELLVETPVSVRHSMVSLPNGIVNCMGNKERLSRPIMESPCMSSESP